MATYTTTAASIHDTLVHSAVRACAPHHAAKRSRDWP